MEFIKKGIHVLSVICYILIIIYGLCCIPMLFKYKPVVVLSGSMRPTYSVGSVIYYKKTPLKELKKGDVITFNVNNTIVSHRIVKINNDIIETKGDANKVKDINKITYDNVLGRVGKYSIPYIGYFINMINSYLILFIVIVSIILISEFVFSNVEK